MAEVHETYYADGIHAVVVGTCRSCKIVPRNGDGERHGYLYVTQNGSVHGRRYNHGGSYAKTVAKAAAWADRPLRQNWNF